MDDNDGDGDDNNDLGCTSSDEHPNYDNETTISGVAGQSTFISKMCPMIRRFYPNKDLIGH